MIIKFFPSNGAGSPKASIDYLLKKPDNHAKILQGDPRLSQEIAESLDFATPYTVGCLSFEEPDLPENQKREIMARFESSMFAGLEPEQYNISWIQHTDKGRLELNFFIPNVEMTSGKRLQPYYDRADRPLAENFKQVINHDYNLTDPNDPRKQQTLITTERLPKAKKDALNAINDGLTALAQAGQIKDRNDVINALERAGFEIARITPKNISIKTEGQNLRLKGAFYEESFRISDNLSADIAERARNHDRDRAERYQTARKRLETAVTKRKQQFERAYPNRAAEIDEKHAKSVQTTERDNFQHIEPKRSYNGDIDLSSEKQISRDDRMAILRRPSQRIDWGDQDHDLQDRARGETLRSSGQDLYQSDLGRQPENFGSIGNKIEQKGQINGERDRNSFREYLENIARTARTRAKVFVDRIAELTGRKRLDPSAIQRNQRTIIEFKQLNQNLEQVIDKKQQEKTKQRQRYSGMSL